MMPNFMKWVLATVCALSLTVPVFYAAYSVGYSILDAAHKAGAKP
jgi:hypothetical protein